jgi:Fibronectin type III domain
VKSGQLVGNHYIEASCSGAVDRFRIEDINACTQMVIGAQYQRLTSLVSPRIDPPAAPTDVLVEVTKGRITVTWLPPADDGGAPIISYRTTSTDGDLTCTSAATTATLQTCSLDGAKAGATYVFTVTATNSAGESAPSAASRPAGFTTVPGRPPMARATLQGIEASVRWKPPKDKGGLKITRYLVRDNRGVTVCTATQTSCAVVGLSYATRYRFSVSAVNARGEGPRQWTAWIRTPQAPPPPPVPSPEPKPEQSLS